MVKGILKRYSRFANPRPVPPPEDGGHHGVPDDSPKQKRVSFDGAEPTKVFEADEWDRSPAAVTLKLTYRDVAELKELNVSLVNPSPLAMARTVSRRPTKKRTPVTTSTSSSPTPPIASPTDSNAAPVSNSSSPGYQYHTFTSQSLTPLLEDVSSPPSHHAADPPPGLPAVRTPMLRGLGSPVLPPPSPLLLSPPLLRPSSPKPVSSHFYIHPRARGNKGAPLVDPGTTEAPVSVVLPTLLTHQPVAQELKLESLMLGSEDDSNEEDEDDKDAATATAAAAANKKKKDVDDDDVSRKWLTLPETDLDNAHPVKEDADELERPLTPVVTRKPAKSLMGWEFKRNALGFGLVRAKPKVEETF